MMVDLSPFLALVCFGALLSAALFAAMWHAVITWRSIYRRAEATMDAAEAVLALDSILARVADLEDALGRIGARLDALERRGGSDTGIQR